MAKTNNQSLVITWFSWHFVQMPALLFEIWKSYLAFCRDFFSVPLLLRTLLLPWRQEEFPRGRGFDIGRFFSALIYNTFSRFMGALLRLALIIIGLLCELAVAVIGCVAIVYWLLLPFIALVLAWLLFYVQF